MKIIINVGMGFFDLSAVALKMFCERKKIPCYFFELEYDTDAIVRRRIGVEECKEYDWDAYNVEDPNGYIKSSGSSSFEVTDLISVRIDPDDFRTDPDLIAVAEECERLGINAGNEINKIKIVEIPDGVEWQIECDDETQSERVAEKHRTWR